MEYTCTNLDAGSPRRAASTSHEYLGSVERADTYTSRFELLPMTVGRGSYSEHTADGG